MTAAFIGEVMSFEPQNRSFLEFDLFPSCNQPIDGQNGLRKNLPEKGFEVFLILSALPALTQRLLWADAAPRSP
jgi:hypothetical protein